MGRHRQDEATGFKGLCRALLGAGIVAIWAGVAVAQPEELPPGPFLQIDAGTHTSAINAVSVAPERDTVLTVSSDKTARLWSLETGALVDTYRVPVELGPEGNLFTAELDPNRDYVMLAGYTRVSARARGWGFYQYDLLEDELLNAYGIFPDNVQVLRYNKNGSLLVVALGDGKVFIFGAGSRSGSQWLMEDAEATIIDAAFLDDDRLITASLDGGVRLYNADYELIGEYRHRNEATPLSLALSPEQSQVVVGYVERADLAILDTDRLEEEEFVNFRTLDGNLGHVAWSQDGEDHVLFAGGRATVGANQVVVLQWRSPVGSEFDLANPSAVNVVSTDVVSDMASDGAGGAVWVSADHSWGRIDGAGRPLYRQDRIALEFRGIGQRARIDPVSQTIYLSASESMTSALAIGFGSGAPTVVPTAEPAGGFPGSTFSALPEPFASRLEGWRDTENVRWDGQALELRPFETSRSAIGRVSADGDPEFVLGTEFGLHTFDRFGIRADRLDTPAPVFGLAAVDRDRMVVAFLGDGTIRWYRWYETGVLEERVALFVDRTGRWLAWTPHGFFTHGVRGGQDMAGYVVNRGRGETPEWVSFAGIYRQFYNPDVVAAQFTDDGPTVAIDRLSAIGSISDLMQSIAPPTTEVIEYCIVTPEGTRGLSRDIPIAGAAGSDRAVPGTDTGSVQLRDGFAVGTEPPVPVEVCQPIDLSTRGLSRMEEGSIAINLPMSGDRPASGANESGDTAGGEVSQAGDVEPQAQTGDASVAAPTPTPATNQRLLSHDQRSIVLEVRLQDGGGGFGTVDVFVNGRATGREQTRGLRRTEPEAPEENGTDVAAQAEAVTTGAEAGSGEDRSVAAEEASSEPETLVLQIPVTLDIGPNEVVIRAYNEAGVFRESTPVRLSVAPPPEPPKPTLFVLAAGINGYGGNIVPLNFAVADATGFATTIRETASAIYSEVRVIELIDEEASRDNIVDALNEIGHQAQPEDAVAIYFAGHGVSEQGSYYFLTADVTDPDPPYDEAFSHFDLIDALSGILARNVIVFLDTCYAGAFSFDAQSNIVNETGRLLLAASASVEEALDSLNGLNGVFAHAVLTGLRGEAAGRRGTIDALDLGQFVRSEVPILAATRNFQQTAMFRTSGGDLLPFLVAAPGEAEEAG